MTATVQVVADTHAFIWYLEGSPRLSEPARTALDGTTEAELPILFTEFVGVLDAEDSGFEVVPVDGEIARAVGRVPREAISDPFDRMIASTALVLDLSLVTRDERLQKLSAPHVVW